MTRRTPNSVLLTRLLPLLNRGPALSAQPFDPFDALVPHTASRRFGWSHNGVMLPNLPEPLRFLSMTTIVGHTGAPISEISHVATPGGAANRASVNISTAATTGFWNAYRLDSECELAPDGSSWRYGDEVTLSGTHPSFRLQARTHELKVDLELRSTDVVSWFVHTPVYRHLSLLARYEGTIAHDGTIHDVEGLGALEHARAFSHAWLRLPLDFFTYQVVDLGDDRQLLLVHVRSQGHEAMSAAFLRDETGRSIAIDKGVRFTVLDHQEPPGRTPDGVSMMLPRRFRWEAEVIGLDLEGRVDTPFSWGLGNGYVGGYSFSGYVEGRLVGGNTGYIEYIDRQA